MEVVEMDFFNKIGDFANKTYQKTSQKTGELAKEAKIKMKMNDNKSKIKDVYSEIGKLVYQNHIGKAEVDVEKTVEDFCVQIDNLSNEIEQAEAELLTLKNKKICEKCKKEIELSAKFCPHCGAEQPEIPVQEAEMIENEENIEEQEAQPEKESIVEESENKEE